MKETCNGKNCVSCVIERQAINEQNNREVEDFMAKKYGFTKLESGEDEHQNPFESLVSELTNKDNETSSIETEFRKVLQSGNIDEIVEWLVNTIKENAQDAQHVRSTARFEKRKSEDERDIAEFKKAVEFGFFDSAMDALNRLWKRDSKKQRREPVYG